MHTKREEKSGIYSSGIEKSLGNGERYDARENRIIIARDGKKFIRGKGRPRDAI